MKNFMMIFFALVLLLATLKADGAFNPKPWYSNSKDFSDQQATTSTLGRKADVGAGEAKDPTANAATTASSLVAAAEPDDDDSNPTFGQYGRDGSGSGSGSKKDDNHHVYTTARNPYAPSKSKNSP
ncbi:hypothetical protein PTKIN_Ptkin09bG0006700 [Pterospermum kingtungense]